MLTPVSERACLVILQVFEFPDESLHCISIQQMVSRSSKPNALTVLVRPVRLSLKSKGVPVFVHYIDRNLVNSVIKPRYRKSGEPVHRESSSAGPPAHALLIPGVLRSAMTNSTRLVMLRDRDTFRQAVANARHEPVRDETAYEFRGSGVAVAEAGPVPLRVCSWPLLSTDSIVAGDNVDVCATSLQFQPMQHITVIEKLAVRPQFNFMGKRLVDARLAFDNTLSISDIQVSATFIFVFRSCLFLCDVSALSGLPAC